MALFDSGGGYGEVAMPNSGRECKPDYEAMIAAEQKKKKAAQELMASIENYLQVNGVSSYGRDKGPIPASIALGSLYLEIKDHEALIAELIRRQEEDK